MFSSDDTRTLSCRVDPELDEKPEQGAEAVLLPLPPHGLAPAAQGPGLEYRGQLFEAPGLFEPCDP